jgi:AraC family transcriptional regulator of adaptative response / DNA-3-methyladenine glycosylase II
LSIARAARAQNARVLLETTTLSAADVASAAGFASVRQFNATIREVFAETPRDLRKRAGASGRRGPARTLELRLPVRQPFNFDQVHGFLARRAIAGVESADAESFTRTLRLPNGHGVVRIAGGDGFVHAEFRLSDLRDLAAATERVRRLCDLDSDPAAADSALSADPELAESVARRPGLRVPGTVDGNELAMRAVLGQQVTVAAATTVAGRLAALCGESIDGDNGPTLLFPTAAVVAELDPKSFAMPQRRAKALVNLARELATGDLQLDGGQDRREVRERLLALPGIGAWTADYIAMRALRDPDAFLPTDIGVRRGLEALGIPIENSERWRPYRAYALQHLWANAAARKD